MTGRECCVYKYKTEWEGVQGEMRDICNSINNTKRKILQVAFQVNYYMTKVSKLRKNAKLANKKNAKLALKQKSNHVQQKCT